MTEQTPEATEPTTQQGDPAGLGEGGKRALEAERAARKAAEKSAADLKARLDAIEQANLTELEKAQRAAKDAQDQLEAVTRQNLVNAAALAKGLPADLVGFITGATEEEVNSQIDTLMARVSAPSTPAPDPTQGPKGDSPSGSTGERFASFIESKLST